MAARKRKWDIAGEESAYGPPSTEPQEPKRLTTDQQLSAVQKRVEELNQKLAAKSGKVDAVVKEVEINDNPARIVLTRGSTHEDIHQATGAVVCTKGRYHPPGDTSIIDERRLYLHVSANTQQEVDAAIKMIEDIMRSKPSLKTLDPPGGLTDKIMVGIASVPGPNNVIGKILGPGGQYIKYVASESGAKVQLRGKGSRYAETNPPSSEDPLHIYISAVTKESFEKAKTLTENLLKSIRDDYNQRLQHQQNHRPKPPPPPPPPTEYPYAGYPGYASYAQYAQYGYAVAATPSLSVYPPQPSPPGYPPQPPPPGYTPQLPPPGLAPSQPTPGTASTFPLPPSSIYPPPLPPYSVGAAQPPPPGSTALAPPGSLPVYVPSSITNQRTPASSGLQPPPASLPYVMSSASYLAAAVANESQDTVGPKLPSYEEYASSSSTLPEAPEANSQKYLRSPSVQKQPDVARSSSINTSKSNTPTKRLVDYDDTDERPSAQPHQRTTNSSMPFWAAGRPENDIGGPLLSLINSGTTTKSKYTEEQEQKYRKMMESLE